MKQHYYISNNTDLQGTRLEFDDLTDAENAWQEYQETEESGNAYAAWFWTDCPTCGKMQQLNVSYDTCSCYSNAGDEEEK